MDRPASSPRSRPATLPASRTSHRRLATVGRRFLVPSTGSMLCRVVRLPFSRAVAAGPRVRRVVALAAVVSCVSCNRVFGPRATLGPGAIVRGRGLYNEVISATNNEQTLQQIVRARYG